MKTNKESITPIKKKENQQPIIYKGLGGYNLQKNKMKKEINLEEIFRMEFDKNMSVPDEEKVSIKRVAFRAMRIACNQVLELATETATVDYDCKEVFGVSGSSILQIKDWIK